jgi:hypothetical protein
VGTTVYTRKTTKSNGTFTVETWSSAAGGVVGSPTTVTITFGAATLQRCALAIDYSGVLGLGVVNTNSGSSTALTVSLTTQDSNNWITAGLGLLAQATMTLVTGTKRGSTEFTTGTSLVAGDNTVVSAGSVTVAFSSNVSAAWACTALELRTVAASSSKGYSSYLPLFGRG